MDILLKETLRSLKDEPGVWEFTGYEATNTRTGVVIWIGSGAFATRVTFPGGYKLPEGENVTSWSCFFGWATWRGRIMRRCNRIRRGRYLAERASMRQAAADALSLAKA